MKKALEGIRILDMTHVQAGPSASQLLAWMGADVIKLESPSGDITRSQLRDIPNADSLYFTMLNANKRSITVNMKTPQGQEVFAELVKKCDIVMENFGPGVLDRLGYSWEKIHAINPRTILASIKGFGSTGPFADLKAYEPIAQAMGGSMSTTGLPDGAPLLTGAQIGDTGTGLHFTIGILGALFQRTHTNQGQYVEVAMMDGIMNLCRVKFRDHQRLARGPLSEYSQPTEGMDAVPRSANDSGGGQLGNAIKCKGDGLNDWVYLVVQEAIWPKLAGRIGGEALANDPRFAKIGERRKNQAELWKILTNFAKDYTKYELTALFNEIDVPCGPVLSTKDLAEHEHTRVREMWVELDHPVRGKSYNVGMPIKLTDSPVEHKRAPLLGEHTEEILKEVCGFDQSRIESMKAAGAFSNPPKKVA
ncbi:MAG TPA: formyl-CoA transferase [Burkholderiales bacterium]